MSRSYRSPSTRSARSGQAARRRHGPQPLVAFIILASFGILFAGCSGPEDAPDETLVFSDEDEALYRQQSQDALSGSTVTASGSDIQDIEALPSGSGALDTAELDLSMVDSYASIRSGAASGAGYQVTNEFLNVREKPSTGAASVGRLNYGDSVSVVEFTDGQWAKIKLASGVEGYVAHRYLSKATSEERLAEEKKQFENVYYVSFGFVNMRKSPDQSSDKLAEIPGNTILRPTQIQGGWAKVTFDGKEGYVSESYLAHFLPNFIVRQETYVLPVLHYRLTSDRTDELLAAMSAEVDALRKEGYAFITLSDFRDVLLAQQQRDVRLDPKRVVVAVSGVTPDNIKAVSSALNVAGIRATLFVQTQYVGLSGITEKSLVTMQANGFDIQSGTHTGDDLRALTNSQAELELRQSRKILEQYTHKPVFAVAYPQGGVNDRIAVIAAEGGYLFGLGDDADRSFGRSQMLRVPAMTVFPSMSVEEVTKFVKGE